MTPVHGDSSRRSILLMLLFLGSVGQAVRTSAQTTVPSQRTPGDVHSPARKTDARVYDDDQIAIKIPAGWNVIDTQVRIKASADAFPALTGYAVPITSKSGLVLEKRGYLLALVHSAGSTRVPGGSFSEVLRIPWLPELSQEETCSVFMRKYPQPVNRRLIFINLVLVIADKTAENACAIHDNRARRWFLGYFTTAGSLSFSSICENCSEKIFTLSTIIKSPAELPDLDDHLFRTIRDEAVGIVDSIRYKRCPPGKDAP